MVPRILAGASWMVLAAPLLAGVAEFDHSYAEYAMVLGRHAQPAGVDYAQLQSERGLLDRAVADLASEAARAEPDWTHHERLAFWINAYNVLTLRAVVDHYPIRNRWFSFQPPNSIRQIDGVWTKLKWGAAGRSLTLDEIEHGILRPAFRDARIHFAINCASVSCPPLARVPYTAATLDAQLDEAARIYVGSAEGAQLSKARLRVSRLFDWYGDDFIDQYAPLVPVARRPKERAILGVIVRYGPAELAAVARQGAVDIAYLDYDWSLNDVRSSARGSGRGRAGAIE
ncbi:MAG: DUF547 domain-containing protein [Acidobacteriota bacterium]